MLKEKSTSISHRGFRRLADAEFNLTLVKSFVKIQHQGKKYQSNQVKSLHFGEFISLSDTYTGYRFDSQMLKEWGCCSLRMGPPFVAAHMFCTSRVWSKIFGLLKEFAY